jgi:hypothetical protein
MLTSFSGGSAVGAVRQGWTAVAVDGRRGWASRLAVRMEKFKNDTRSAAVLALEGGQAALLARLLGITGITVRSRGSFAKLQRLFDVGLAALGRFERLKSGPYEIAGRAIFLIVNAPAGG